MPRVAVNDCQIKRSNRASSTARVDFGNLNHWQYPPMATPWSRHITFVGNRCRGALMNSYFSRTCAGMGFVGTGASSHKVLDFGTLHERMGMLVYDALDSSGDTSELLPLGAFLKSFPVDFRIECRYPCWPPEPLCSLSRLQAQDVAF
jgi:hypothetical protein